MGTNTTLEALERALTYMILFEVWDSQTRETVKTWLNLQGIECLLPDFTAPDHSVTIAIKLDGCVHYLIIGD